ncbi:hypothetical protein [Blastococcus capsensis]|uniref:hypothetical protein n=1 Tax=Blastococcus capsensis TaxID=1564163 RepID=UPI00253FF424|nr:hypothetical protein [Blastococcus capsensis]MDK3255622.1 hypothetical protein [Blastococcus capsensis]
MRMDDTAVAALAARPAADALVPLRSSGRTGRLDGSPLVYNRPDPSLSDLVVTRPGQADRVLAAVRSAR